MNNILLIVFEDKIFDLYDKSSLSKYFNFFNQKVDTFCKKLNLNLVLVINQKNVDIIKNHFDKAIILNYENSIKSILKRYSKFLYEKFNIEENKEIESFTLFLSASYPFFSYEKNEFILTESQKYLVDYYYGENFPEGIVGEVFNNSILNELIKLSNDKDIYHHNIIFDILLRNISIFDVDLVEGFDYYLPYRISFSISDYSSLPIIAKLSIEKDKEQDRDKDNEKEKEKVNFDFFENLNINIKWEYIEERLKEKEILYTIPKTYIIELSSKCNFNCIHCLYPLTLNRKNEFLNKNLLFDFVEKNNIYFKDVVFIIGGFGEPFIHPDFYEIINFLSRKNKVFIETNGSFLSEDIFENFSNISNINLVISIDAIKVDTYKKLGKNMILSFLLNTVVKLLNKYPDNIYISYLRIPQNDDELEEFYNFFQKYEKNIIFRKYNSYSKKLPDIEVADLTPVERFPCYHLRREVFILSDGRIALCYSDYNGQILNSNISEPIENIFQKMKYYYSFHCKENYENICENCNEFYTYFF